MQDMHVPRERKQGQVHTDLCTKIQKLKTTVSAHHQGARKVRICRSITRSLDIHKWDAVDFSASL